MHSTPNFFSQGAVLTVLSCVFATGLGPERAFAQPDRITITQAPDATGRLLYEVDTLNSLLLFSGSGFVAPDGTPLGLGFGVAPRLAGLTFAELQTLVVGEWTINVGAGPGPPGPPVDVLNFTIDPFTLGDVFSETPTLVSPAAGATVGASFDLAWEWPSGVTPPNGVSASVGGFDGRVDFDRTGPADYRINLEPDPGVVTDLIRVRGGSSQELPGLISQAVSATPGNAPIDIALFFRSLSAQREVTFAAVPEPAGVALVAACVGVAGGGRSRR